jgi:flagellar hook-associated protein 2
MSNLDSYYQSLINYTLAQEKVPVTNLTKKKDEITVKKAMYSDLKGKFDTLNSAIQSLRSSDATFALTAGRSVSVSPAVSGTTVASAAVGSSVSAGTYALSVTKLATAHEVRSTRQTYSDQALGMVGTFVIGGADVRSAAIQGGTENANTVASIESNGTTSIATGQKELGSGAYYIETRKDSSDVWQFRIVNAEGVAQNIQDISTSDFTTGWQNINKGTTYDSGRGLKVTFGGDDALFTAGSMGATSGAVQVNYVAQGASIAVTDSMSLVDINYAINNATYALGNEVTSSIIDNTLVLKSQYTGTAHSIQTADSAGQVLRDLGVFKEDPDNLGNYILNTKVNSGNASFSINGMAMTRSSNTGLTDVITGMTLNLASDAEGKSANLVVNGTMTAANNAIMNFVNAFNDLTTYVRGKTTTVKNADNTYTRGSLVGEQNLRYSATDLINVVNQDQTNTGIYQNLSQLGLSVNSDLALSVTDSTKLSTALNNNLADVTKIMDVAMSSLSSKIETYVGTTGYISQSLTNVDTTIKAYADRITSMNERLTRRQDSLVKQYQDIQSQMSALTSTYNMNNTLYG